MARKLATEFPDKESGATMPDVQAVAEVGKEKGERKWLPFTTTNALPPALTKEKTRVIELPNGLKHVTTDLKYLKAGEPRYSVTQNGELIAHYQKRGGVGRKLVFQFKRTLPDTQEGRKRRVDQEAFRRMLRAKGIPGA